MIAGPDSTKSSFAADTVLFNYLGDSDLVYAAGNEPPAAEYATEFAMMPTLEFGSGLDPCTTTTSCLTHGAADALRQSHSAPAGGPLS